jgi:hypothetical protein
MEEGNVLEENAKPKFMKAYIMKIKSKIHGFQKTSKQASRNFGLLTFQRNKDSPVRVIVCHHVNAVNLD